MSTPAHDQTDDAIDPLLLWVAVEMPDSTIDADTVRTILTTPPRTPARADAIEAALGYRVGIHPQNRDLGPHLIRGNLRRPTIGAEAPLFAALYVAPAA